MTQEDRDAIIAVIKETVNGKIDRLTDKVEQHNVRHEEDMTEVRQHMADVKPMLDALNGSKVLGSLIKWIAGIVAAIVLIQQFLLK